MDSWLNMVLLCGLLLIASLQTTNAFRFRRSKSEKNHLEQNIHALQKHYKTRDTESVTKSGFASHLEQNSKVTCTCQKLLLERMLNTYEELFQEMEKSEQKEVKNELEYVIAAVKKLRQKYSEEKKVWKQLWEIEGKNRTTQGALNDFLMVFEEASKGKGHYKLQ